MESGKSRAVVDRRMASVGLISVFGAAVTPVVLCGRPSTAVASPDDWSPPPNMARLLEASLTADEKLKRLMPAIVSAMSTDRCFIYMRDPKRRMTAYTHSHSALADWHKRATGHWSREPNPATLNEPMLKKAFHDQTPLFIVDIERAPPQVLNRSLERAIFGHRALVHAPLHHQGIFYGVLETAVRDSPRVWSDTDRQLIQWLQPQTAALCAQYLNHI